MENVPESPQIDRGSRVGQEESKSEEAMTMTESRAGQEESKSKPRVGGVISKVAWTGGSNLAETAMRMSFFSHFSDKPLLKKRGFLGIFWSLVVCILRMLWKGSFSDVGLQRIVCHSTSSSSLENVFEDSES